MISIVLLLPFFQQIVLYNVVVVIVVVEINKFQLNYIQYIVFAVVDRLDSLEPLYLKDRCSHNDINIVILT